MTITAALLQAACGASASDAEKYAASLDAACARYAINTPLRLAAFLSQIGHESAGLSATVESFNYSTAGLTATWPRKMPTDIAAKLGRQPGEKTVPLARQQKIANIVYAGKLGNGDAATGDGWAFRGSGLVQITFRNNFAQLGHDVCADLVTNPDKLRTDIGLSAMSAGWFWTTNGCNVLADARSFSSITRRINGPAMAGEAHREALYAAAKHALGC